MCVCVCLCKSEKARARAREREQVTRRKRKSQLTFLFGRNDSEAKGSHITQRTHNTTHTHTCWQITPLNIINHNITHNHTHTHRQKTATLTNRWIVCFVCFFVRSFDDIARYTYLDFDEQTRIAARLVAICATTVLCAASCWVFVR